jgi:hypothetical protein
VTSNKYNEFAVAYAPNIARIRQVRAEKITPFDTARFLLGTGCSKKGRCPH